MTSLVGREAEVTVVRARLRQTDVRLPALTLCEVQDGKIATERNSWDNAGLLAQLGLMPDPAHGRTTSTSA